MSNILEDMLAEYAASKGKGSTAVAVEPSTAEASTRQCHPTPQPTQPSKEVMPADEGSLRDGGVRMPPAEELFTSEHCDKRYAALKEEAAERLGAALTKAERSKMRSQLWRQVKKEQASHNKQVRASR